MFSGGYDLKEMQKGPKEAMALVKVGSPDSPLVCNPRPVIAAVATTRLPRVRLSCCLWITGLGWKAASSWA